MQKNNERLLFLSTTFPLLENNHKDKKGNHFTYIFCLTCETAGYNVTVLTPLKKGFPSYEKIDNIEVIRFSSPFIKHTSTYNFRPLYKFKNILDLIATLLLFFSYLIAIKKTVTTKKITLIWALWLQIGFLAHMATRNIPIFTSLLGTDVRGFPKILTSVLSRIISAVLNVFPGDQEIRSWIDTYKFKSISIPVSYLPKNIKHSNSTKKIAIIGRLENTHHHLCQKGIGESLFFVLKDLLSKYDDLHVVVVGDGTEKDKFALFLEEYSDRVEFTGWKDQIEQYLDGVSFAIGGSGHNGVVLDTVPNSIPVIITKYNPAQDFWTHKKNTLLFDPLDKKNYSETLEYAIKNPTKMRKYAEQAKSDLEEYALPVKKAAVIWKKTFEEYIKTH